MSRRRRRRAPARPNVTPVSPAIADELVIREPQSPADLAALHYLRLVQGDEMAQAPVNPTKVMLQLVHAAQHPETHTMLMAIKGDRLVGYLLLEQRQWDYSDEWYIGDWGFWVLPQFRGEDVGTQLLQDARALAEIEQLPLYIAIGNPTRRRGMQSEMERVASRIGFSPQGYLLRFGKNSQLPALANEPNSSNALAT